MNIQSYPTYHTKEEDFKFEKNYIPSIARIKAASLELMEHS